MRAPPSRPVWKDKFTSRTLESSGLSQGVLTGKTTMAVCRGYRACVPGSTKKPGLCLPQDTQSDGLYSGRPSNPKNGVEGFEVNGSSSANAGGASKHRISPIEQLKHAAEARYGELHKFSVHKLSIARKHKRYSLRHNGGPPARIFSCSA